jgi:hypothetical protein
MPLTNIASLGLVSETVDNLRRGADKGETSLFNFAGKASVLRKETIAINIVNKLLSAEDVTHTQGESCLHHARGQYG